MIRKKKPVAFVMALTNEDGTMRYWANLKEGGLTDDIARAKQYSLANSVRMAWRVLKDRPSIGFVKINFAMSVAEVPIS